MFAPSSDGLSSGVELPPLLAFNWLVVSDPESVLLSTDIFAEEKWSISLHPRFNLELHSVLEWLLWSICCRSFMNNAPGLVETVVAVPPSQMLVVLIFAAIDIKALVCVVA